MTRYSEHHCIWQDDEGFWRVTALRTAGPGATLRLDGRMGFRSRKRAKRAARAAHRLD